MLLDLSPILSSRQPLNSSIGLTTITHLVRNDFKDLQFCLTTTEHNIMAIIGNGNNGRVHHLPSSLHHGNGIKHPSVKMG